jgi:light-regulated signal transduction histidine kinase (bacteriophytochrome)
VEPEEEKQFLKNIQTSAHRLDKMIVGLLAYADNRNQKLSYQVISPSELVEELKQKFSREHTSPPIQWEIGELPDCVGDEGLLRQVWENLLSNAIKYSSGKPQIHIKVWGEKKDDETLYVVQDQGAGFDMRFADKLFAIFQRLHINSEFPGNGIGLANVQRILLLHGGRIWAEGVVNEGATFFFTLPNKPAES